MDVTSVPVDNLTIVLTQILEFTHRRHQILSRNLFDFHKEGFVPTDLPLNEFTNCMTIAVSEHLNRDRLLFQDTNHVRFTTDGLFETDPIVDEHGLQLLKEDVSRYLRLQMKKLTENKSNIQIARQLLTRKKERSTLKSENTANKSN